jgi:hypothetical protein
MRDAHIYVYQMRLRDRARQYGWSTNFVSHTRHYSNSVLRNPTCMGAILGGISQKPTVFKVSKLFFLQRIVLL